MAFDLDLFFHIWKPVAFFIFFFDSQLRNPNQINVQMILNSGWNSATIFSRNDQNGFFTLPFYHTVTARKFGAGKMKGRTSCKPKRERVDSISPFVKIYWQEAFGCSVSLLVELIYIFIAVLFSSFSFVLVFSRLRFNDFFQGGLHWYAGPTSRDFFRSLLNENKMNWVYNWLETQNG